MSKRCVRPVLAFALIGWIGVTGCHPEKAGVVTQPAKAAAPARPAPAHAAPAADTSPEHLLAQAPDGWQQSFHTEGAAIRMVDYIPPHSDPETWTEKVSFESFSDPPLPDPIELLKSIAADQRKTCTKFADHDTFSGLENDYPTSVRLFVCYENPLTKQGQLTLVKTIKGDARFYVITRAKRVPPIQSDSTASKATEAEIAKWSLYLHAIRVCNATDPRHPCPSPVAAKAASTPPNKSE